MAGSKLLVDEYFRTGDPLFLVELASLDDPSGLKALAERWFADARPFAREAVLAIALRSATLRRHRPLIKTLFKKAEAAGDDQLMGHFLVGFDGFQLREGGTHSVSFVRTIPGHAPVDRSGKPGWPSNRRLDQGIFSRATCRYLQRRAWRYFRRLGHQDPQRYRTAMLATLPLYTEESLSSSVRLLDSWGLVHALYGESPVLNRLAKAADVRAGRTLAELTAAPAFSEVWKTGAFRPLVELFLTAKSNPVRSWALALLRRDYVEAMRDVPMELVRRLLRHDADDAKALGAELLANAEGLATLPMNEWLALLKLEQPAIMPKIVELLRKHVTPDRLDLAQCLSLATSSVAPVAEVGLSWAQTKRVTSDRLDVLLPFATAKVTSVRAAATAWLVQLLNLAEGNDLAFSVRELLDSSYADVRAAALQLMTKDQRFGGSVVLWTAMSESPWPDVRVALAPVIERHEGAFAIDQLRTVWASTLLAIHRGGRAKRQAVTQLARRLSTSPSEAASLLPLLAHSLRSVRPTERRAALAALSQACFKAPALQASVTLALPELRFIGDEVAS